MKKRLVGKRLQMNLFVFRGVYLTYYLLPTALHTFNADDVIETIAKVNSDLGAINNFAESHSLKLKPSKTVAVLFGKPGDIDRVKDNVLISINGSTVPLSTEAKNLGLVIDNSVRYMQRVAKTVSTAYCNLIFLTYRQKPCFVKLLSYLPFHTVFPYLVPA